jgi:hypothetical protein
METLFPIIINKMTGKKVLSESETSVLKTFVTGLTQEQVMGIAQQLSNEQKIAFITMYKEMTSPNN